MAAAGRKALSLRYRLLPFLYTAHYLAHREGGAVAQPLLFLAPEDARAR